MKHRIIISAATLAFLGASAATVALATTNTGAHGVSVSCTRTKTGQVTMSVTASGVSALGSFVLKQGGVPVFSNFNVELGGTATNTATVTPGPTTFLFGYIITGPATDPDVGHGYTLQVNCGLAS